MQDYRRLLERRKAGAPSEPKQGRRAAADRRHGRRSFPNRRSTALVDGCREHKENMTMTSSPFDPQSPAGHPRPPARAAPAAAGPDQRFLRAAAEEPGARRVSCRSSPASARSTTGASRARSCSSSPGSAHLPDASGHRSLRVHDPVRLPLQHRRRLEGRQRRRTRASWAAQRGRGARRSSRRPGAARWCCSASLILLNNLGWLDLDRLARYWPLLLIAVGALLRLRLARSAKGRGRLRRMTRSAFSPEGVTFGVMPRGARGARDARQPRQARAACRCCGRGGRSTLVLWGALELVDLSDPAAPLAGRS